MGRRSGDQTHFTATGPERDTQAHFHTKKIGLSARHKDQHTRPVKQGINRQQLAKEQAHSRYPFGKSVYWLSLLVFISFVVASLYWITYFASTS
ncbi:hypothetical protein OEZ86_011115 [Tetradesmus obliquus]|nr:hypothetical protein OEZ86_011115 [Tetradesmus obliquus]